MARPLPELPGVSHRFVRAGELDMHVAEAGAGDPVLLLHGWPQHWYAWRAVIPRLAERHRVLAADLRGFGWTDAASTGFEKEGMAEDVLRLLDALGVERTAVVGHDWGAWIGFLMALRRPERVTRLVALSASHPWPRVGPRHLADALRFAYMPVVAAPLVGRRLVARPSLVRRAIRSGSTRRDAFTEADLAAYARDLQTAPRAGASSLLYRTFLLRELLPVLAGRYRRARLTTPTLIMQGADDPVVVPRLAFGAESHADHVEVEIVPGAGHFLPEERPEVVAERVLEFLAAGDERRERLRAGAG